MVESERIFWQKLTSFSTLNILFNYFFLKICDVESPFQLSCKLDRADLTFVKSYKFKELDLTHFHIPLVRKYILLLYNI